jgi:hypothetical protein
MTKEQLIKDLDKIKQMQSNVVPFMVKIRITDDLKDDFKMAIGWANVELGFGQFIEALEKHIEKINENEKEKEKSEFFKFMEGRFKAERLNRKINLEIMSYVYGSKTEIDTKRHNARMKEILKNIEGNR